MAELFLSVPRTQTTGQAVEQHIKELIKARRLLAGDKLPPERQLAQRLGVSRSTLRAALLSLSEQGVITARQGSGWIVQPSREVVAANLAVYLSLEEVTFDELFAARQAIEPPIAASAAEHRTEAQISAMERCIQAMETTSEPESYLQADSDFHALLAAASQNAVFSLIIMPTFHLLHELRQRLASEHSVVSASHLEHRQILEAIRRQDPEAAKQAMLKHIEHFVARGRLVLQEAQSLSTGRKKDNPEGC